MLQICLQLGSPNMQETHNDILLLQIFPVRMHPNKAATCEKYWNILTTVVRLFISYNGCSYNDLAVLE